MTESILIMDWSECTLILLPLATWKRSKTGDLSTAGTTASIVIFRQDHIIVANVGDSTVVLGKALIQYNIQQQKVFTHIV